MLEFCTAQSVVSMASHDQRISIMWIEALIIELSLEQLNKIKASSQS